MFRRNIFADSGIALQRKLNGYQIHAYSNVPATLNSTQSSEETCHKSLQSLPRGKSQVRRRHARLHDLQRKGEEMHLPVNG